MDLISNSSYIIMYNVGAVMDPRHKVESAIGIRHTFRNLTSA